MIKPCNRKKALKFIPSLFFILLILSSLSFSQASQLCEIVSKPNSCIEMREGSVIQVPYNVQLFGDEVGFCPANWKIDIKPVQLIICIDRSGSMQQTDPSIATVKVAKAFVDSVIKRSPQSSVGIVLFSDRVSYNGTYSKAKGLLPLTLNSTANINTVKAWIDSASNRGNGTPYGATLDTTIALFSKLPASTNRAVIFLSDGAPQAVQTATSDDSLYTLFLGIKKYAQLPPTHTVYFHPQNNLVPAARDTLTHLANLTKGTYNDAADSTRLRTVFIDSLLGKIVKVANISSFIIYNKTTNEIKTTGKVISSDPNFMYVNMEFPPIKLEVGTNDINVGYKQIMDNGVDSIVYKSIKIVRLPQDVNTPPADSTFLTRCYDKSTTAFTNNAWINMISTANYDTLTDSVRIKVTCNPPSDTIRLDKVILISKSGDEELVALRETGANTNTYRGSIYLGNLTSPTTLNSVLEINSIDTLIAIFKNSAVVGHGDSLDVSKDTIPVNYCPDTVSSVNLYTKPGNPLTLTPLDICKEYPEPITMSIEDTINLYAKFFTVFGHWVGSATLGDTAKVKWSIKGFPGLINPPDAPSYKFNFSNIPTDSVSKTGLITITKIWNTTTFTDSVLITVMPNKPANMVKAFTRDTDGNGYLDKMEVLLDARVIFADTIGALSSFKILNDSTHFYVSGIAPIGIKTDVMNLIIKENVNTKLETAMRPTLEFANVNVLKGVLLPGLLSDSVFDGAGPVIDIAQINDRGTAKINDDVARLFWSESVNVVDKSNWPKADIYLKIWQSNGNEIPNYLVGCGTFDALLSNKALFTTRNGSLITDSMLVNLDSVGSMLKDLKGNVVLSGNRKVRFAKLSSSLDLVSDFELHPNPILRSMINSNTDVGKFVFKVHDSSNVSIEIYDLAGNLVKNLGTRILSPGVNGSASNQEIGWNGRNGYGRAVSPGGYIAKIIAVSKQGRKSTQKMFKVLVK